MADIWPKIIKSSIKYKKLEGYMINLDKERFTSRFAKKKK
jgi:hypothetical protein